VQLDKTCIAVRERNLLDTMDLSLHVLRAYWRPLVVTMVIGVAPLMLVDWLTLRWMAQSFDYYWDFPIRYVWHITVLVFIQAPLGSIFATSYLGQAVFLEQPKIRSVLADVFKLMPRVAWCQVLVRGVLPAWLISFAVERGGEFNFALEGFLLFLLVVYSGALRAFRPFMNEIVLLERNPLTSRNKKLMTVNRRSNALHTPSSADLVFRWVGSAAIGCLLALSVYGMCIFLSGVFLNDWQHGPLLLELCLPLSLWIVAGYFTVFRFLSYLDLRIRQEGWEVELRLRAEATRMKNSMLTGLLAAGILFGWGPSAWAADAAGPIESGRQALGSGDYYPWYDYDNDAVRRLDVEAARDTAEHRNSTWRAKPPTANQSSWGGWSPLGEIVRWMLWGSLILLAAVLAALLIRAFLASESRRAASMAVEEEIRTEEDLIESLPFQVKRPRTDLLGEARRHYEQGNYGEAVIYLFSYQLVRLDQHHLIRLTRGKTNRQYLYEVWQAPELRDMLQRTMLAFEDVFFGHHPLDRERFEQCWSRLDDFHQRLELAGQS